MTPSERFVQALTQAACLRLWTYASPQGKGPGKELCDTLVACPPEIIVISVKQINLDPEADDVRLATERWKRKAVDESVHQVYGAVRRLSTVETVVATDGSLGVSLGPVTDRRVRRIAVAIGAEGLIPLESGDFGNGFVHVFCAEAFLVVLQEADTITDFVDYLDAREELLTRVGPPAIVASEHDLLAVYLMNMHSFNPLLNSDRDLLLLTQVWEGFAATQQFALRKEANERSYVWDRLIEMLHDDLLADNIEFGDLNSIDQVTRLMAREDRTQRRMLAESFIEFIDRKDLESRIAMSSSGVTYLFLKAPHSEERKYRTRDLEMRSWVARSEAHKQGRNGPVVGLATEIREPGSGSSLDAMLLIKPDWSEADTALVEELREHGKFFSNAVVQHGSTDEFPTAE